MEKTLKNTIKYETTNENDGSRDKTYDFLIKLKI